MSFLTDAARSLQYAIYGRPPGADEDPAVRDHRSVDAAGAARDWMTRIEADPETGIRDLMEAWPTLPDEVRNNSALQIMVQHHTQQLNRQVAFMANMQTALHETTKAIINAIRV